MKWFIIWFVWVWHPISQTSGVRFYLRWIWNADSWVSLCRGCRGVFLVVEISRSSRIKTYELRDLLDVYNGLEWMCWEIYIYGCLQIVYRWFGTQSLKHLALDFTFGEYGTLIREQVCAGDAGVIFLRLKSLGVHGLKRVSWEIYRMFI